LFLAIELFALPEMIHYAYVQTTKTSWLVVHTEVKKFGQLHLSLTRWLVFPLAGFKGPPQFKELHQFNRRQHSCLLMWFERPVWDFMHYLFSLEPVYDVGDINYCYQTAYAYFGYHPDHGPITHAFKACNYLKHQGVRRKPLI
jgi:hypothetical protein